MTVLGNEPLTIQQFLDTDPWYYVDQCRGVLVLDGDNKPIELTPPAGGFFDMSSAVDTQHGCETEHIWMYENGMPGGKARKIQSGFMTGDWRTSGRR